MGWGDTEYLAAAGGWVPACLPGDENLLMVESASTSAPTCTFMEKAAVEASSIDWPQCSPPTSSARWKYHSRPDPTAPRAAATSQHTTPLESQAPAANPTHSPPSLLPSPPSALSLSLSVFVCAYTQSKHTTSSEFQYHQLSATSTLGGKFTQMHGFKC